MKFAFFIVASLLQLGILQTAFAGEQFKCLYGSYGDQTAIVGKIPNGESLRDVAFVYPDYINGGLTPTIRDSSATWPLDKRYDNMEFNRYAHTASTSTQYLYLPKRALLRSIKTNFVAFLAYNTNGRGTQIICSTW